MDGVLSLSGSHRAEIDDPGGVGLPRVALSLFGVKRGENLLIFWLCPDGPQKMLPDLTVILH